MTKNTPVSAVAPTVAASYERALKTLAQKGELYLRIKVIPNATLTKIKEVMSDETWKITVAAKPEKNLANRELIKYLSKLFKVDKSHLSVIGGRAERLKMVKIIDR